VLYVVNEDKVVKVLCKLPVEIRNAYSVWRSVVLEDGLKGLRTVKGFHLEKLKGNRLGQCSCRLNRGYRVVFEKQKDNFIIVVLEVTKHEY